MGNSFLPSQLILVSSALVALDSTLPELAALLVCDVKELTPQSMSATFCRPPSTAASSGVRPCTMTQDSVS